MHLRIILPEKLSCLAIDVLGNYCAGGTSTGRIYLWEASTYFSLSRVQQFIHGDNRWLQEYFSTLLRLIIAGLQRSALRRKVLRLFLLVRTLGSACGQLQGKLLFPPSHYRSFSRYHIFSRPVRLLDNSVQNETPTPYYTLSDHTLPVTDIVCGVGGFPHCRVLTASLDNSCKASCITIFVVHYPPSNCHGIA